MSTETIERLENEIANQKEALRYNVEELQERARDVVDWRVQVQRHPLAIVGVAAVGGFLIATRFRPSIRALRGLGALASTVLPIASRLVIAPARKAAKRRREKEMPTVKRVVRDARRKASHAASRMADRLSVPSAWEESGARRAQRHPS